MLSAHYFISSIVASKLMNDFSYALDFMNLDSMDNIIKYIKLVY